MEPIIQTLTPSSSPILAFGRSSSVPPYTKLLAIIAGVFAVFVIGAVIVFRAKIPVPEHLLFTAAVRGGTKLPDGVPTVWKRAVEHTSAPSILGLAVVNGSLIPFALTTKNISDSALNIERSGAITFASESDIPRSATRPLRDLLALASQTIVHPAYLILDPRALDERLGDRIEGPVDSRGVWKTDIRLATKSFTELPPGDVAVDLDAFPEAWPILTSISREADFPLEIDERPSQVGWSSSSDSTPFVDLRWTAPISTSTKVALAAAAGIEDVSPYRLPDGVVVDELRLPQDAHPSSTILTDREFSNFATGNEAEMRACREGRPVLRLTRDALTRILISVGFSYIPYNFMVEFAEAGGKLEVCTRS